MALDPGAQIAAAFRLGAAALLFGVALSAPAAAQQDEPLLGELRSTLTRPWMTVGALFVTTVDLGLEDRATSASVRAARLRLSGNLDGGFSYFLQTNFAASPALLDARIGWSPDSAFTLWAGRFKTPYSRELLAYLGDLDFIARARVVDALSPNRQVGMQATWRAGDHLAWSLGGFTGTENAARNESLIGVARLEGMAIPVGEGTLSVAGQAAVGRDAAITGRAYPLTFEGDGFLLGGDARFELGRLLLAGEFHRAEWEPVAAADTDAQGAFVTAGWMVRSDQQVLVRWDNYRAPVGQASDFLVLGYNAWPTSAAQVQVNWLAPVDESGAPHQVLVSFELRF